MNECAYDFYTRLQFSWQQGIHPQIDKLNLVIAFFF
jgi:hypothetical protein